MPAFSITAAHFAMSSFMRCVIASGVLPRISMPSFAAFSCTSGPREDLVDGAGKNQSE
jgi:hypothetical protein